MRRRRNKRRGRRRRRRIRRRGRSRRRRTRPSNQLLTCQTRKEPKAQFRLKPIRLVLAMEDGNSVAGVRGTRVQRRDPCQRELTVLGS